MNIFSSVILNIVNYIFVYIIGQSYRNWFSTKNIGMFMKLKVVGKRVQNWLYGPKVFHNGGFLARYPRYFAYVALY
jgi:hypothetical protein